ncbi:UNVERIFIED_CONTAM: Protein smg7 [Gekko kuhli]
MEKYSFQPHEEDLSCPNATPLPEEFELQGFLALRPSFRNLDFSKGHQGITGDKEGQHRRLRQQRLVFTGKWIADNQPRLIQCENEVGKLLFLTEIPELLLDEPSEAKQSLVLQEASLTEPQFADGSPGLKSVLSTGRNLSSSCDTGDKPMVTFKENIKPREVKSQTELRKTPVSEARKTPVTQSPNQASNSQFIPIHHPGAFPPLPSRPGFPPPAYVIPPPVAFSMSSGYTFPGGVSVPGTFLQPAAHSPAGNQVQAGKQSHIPYSQQRPSGPGPMNQGPQQTPSPSQQPLSSLSAQATVQSASQLQVQALAQQQQQQQQQSPTKAVQTLGKSPPHHSGFQQYSQADASKQLWNPPQVQGPLGKIMPVKQSYYLQSQDPLKLFEQSLQPPLMQQQQPLEKKMKPFPMEPYNQNPSEVKVPEFYWDSYMADNRVVMAQQQANMDRRGKRQQGVFRPEQDAVPRMGFEDPKSSPLLPPDLLKSLAALEEEEELIFSNPPDLYPALLGPLASLPGRSLFKSLLEKPSDLMSQSPSFLSLTGFSLNQERYPNSMFNEVYGKNLNASTKPDVTPSVAHQETSLYSLFEGTPWSPSLPASSDHSTPASQSPHSSNPSSLPSSPPTHNHNSVPFSNFGPIGTPDNRDRRVADRWKTDKPAMGGFGLDYLPATSSSSESSWHPSSTPSGTWAAHGPAIEDSSAVLMESLKSIWSSSMMHPGPSALEQLLMQQKQKQQRGQGAMNPPH